MTASEPVCNITETTKIEISASKSDKTSDRNRAEAAIEELNIEN